MAENVKTTTIAVFEKDREKAKVLTQIYGVKMAELFAEMVCFFDENREFFNPKKEDDTTEKVTDLLEQKITKNMTKQVNRLIGFTKVQDELLREIQQEIRHSTKQILFKMIPKDEQDFLEYNPLFDDFENVIFIQKKMLEKKGISSKEMEAEIKKELGENTLKKYQESSEKIRIKNFLK